MSNRLNWHEWSAAHDEPEQEPEEIPQEHHAWFRPFHGAITSGLVDGGGAYGDGETNNGSVSE